MSGNIRDLFDNQAELDDDEDDESFDEETGETTRRKPREGRVEDSSEEEDDDDDEEEARRIREGFIVDEDEDEEEGEGEENRERRKKKKRRRAERDDEEKLDEEDLDLIGEAIPSWERNKETAQSKFKRLKRGHRDEDEAPKRRGLAEIFSDEDDEVVDDRAYGRPSHRAQADEFDDFIEEDFPEDEEERNQRMEDMEVARAKGLAGTIVDAAGLDKDALDDMERIFGTGEEYDWALQLEDEEEDRERDEQVIELKDVFEPSQLVDKLLTDEDNEIRFTDEPERFQIERRPFKNLQLTSDQFKEEGRWITNLMWPKKVLAKDLEIPFTKAVGKILEFFVVDGVEVPYIFQHRRDYLIYDRKNKKDRRDYDDGGDYAQEAEKLLNQDDLWRILELDIKFRSLIEKRNTLEKTWDNLKAVAEIDDPVLQEMIPKTETMEDLQDLQDYLNFQYSAQLKEINTAANGEHKELRRPGAKSGLYERIRRSRAYNFVKAYGITPDRLARNAMREGAKVTSDDDAKRPDELADSLADGDFLTADSVINAARSMYAEELFVSPRMRKYFRMAFYEMGVVSCRRTEKGLRRIDESHPFYEIKYLVNQTIRDLARQPEIFLKMMKAEEEGLVEVQLRLEQEREFRRGLYTEFASDNFSELADAWNEERQKVLDLAFSRLEKVITKGVKDSLRTACQEELLNMCRQEYFRRLDQAPYKPKGLELGTIPRVLALSNGMGDVNRDGVDWAYVDENGRVLEHGRFTNLARDADQRDKLEEIVRRRELDVIGVSGFSADTHRLIKDLENLVSEKNLTGPPYRDEDDREDRVDQLDVIVVNDEVARLYKDNPRAIAEHPTLPPLTRYCVALAQYMQNPLKEYAALGKDVISLSIHPYQNLLPQDKLYKVLETAMVDMVNLCGVNINEAISDPYTAYLLPYIAGLGPRKATMVIKGINQNGGVLTSRDELVGDPDLGKLPVVGPRVWNNCAGFLIIPWDKANPQSDPLDATRVHPEDYDLARKVAADALGLDEEDVKAETDENGVAAIVRKMLNDGEEDRVNELILEEYADQLLQNYQQRKRATLETIRGELQNAFEELRKNFAPLTADQIFTMLTGETRDSLCEGMIVPVYTRIVKDDFAVVKLDCGIEGRIEAHEVSSRHSIKDALNVGQTVQAKLIEVNRKDFIAKLTMREEEMRRPYKKHIDQPRGAWDYNQEDIDREELREKDKVTGRTQRVINHPLFKPFNSTQAEEFLGGQAPGEVVIRPSSKGNDHLAITWKVADGVYQHVDVLELQKDNEFSVGKILKVGGKYTYSDLDELIVDHIKAMARKVDELIQHEKFQKGSRADIERWLTTYMDANPNRSTYAFCIDTKHAGYFWLCFKASKNSKVAGWPVRVIPHAYELMKNQYPDVRSLCNGFKLRYQNEMLRTQQGGGGGR